MPKNQIVTNAVVFDTQGQILLVRRGSGAPKRPGQWELPGGIVEPGEDPADGMMRELAEETGLEITATAHDMVFAFSHADRIENLTVLVYRLHTADSEVRLSSEHDQMQWLPLEQAIITVDHPPHRMALERVQLLQLYEAAAR